jgi:hypothetical protein
LARLLPALCIALLVAACNATQSGGTTALGSPQSGARTAEIPSSGRITITGDVERVWEDGFRLNTGGRSVKVDTWDVFGDNTRAQLSAGQRVSVSGEMSRGEFDAVAVNPVAP